VPRRRGACHRPTTARHTTAARESSTLFITLTLENLPDQVAQAGELSEWTILHLVSYALIAAFLLFNILINALEEAWAIEHARERADGLEHGDPDEPVIEGRIAEVRDALARPEADVKRARA